MKRRRSIKRRRSELRRRHQSRNWGADARRKRKRRSECLYDGRRENGMAMKGESDDERRKKRKRRRGERFRRNC